MDDIKDVVPGLLKWIQEDFQKQYKADKVVNEILFKQRSKMATYKEANEFSIRVGEMLANSFSKFLTPDSLPDGRMYYNIATRILEPTLHTNYSLITDVCKAAQTKINKDAGIGLKVIKPAFNKDRLKGLEDKVSNAEQFEDVQWVLKEPVVNFSQSIVDDSIKDNAEFHYKSGLTPKIRRTAESGCCKWCANLEGEYEYPYVPSNVYRKHENCRCTVEYIEDGKYKQNVHNKQWVGDVPPRERQKQILQQEKANQAATKRETEKQAVQALMKAHPDWTEEGATIYYRTNVAPNLYPETRQERIVSGKRADNYRLQARENRIYANTHNDEKEALKVSENYGVKAKDVTRIYYNEATPNKGVIEYQEGYKAKDRTAEIKTANIIHKALGGDITLIVEDPTKTNYDFSWLEAAWELKNPSSLNGIDQLVRKGLRQISEIPGGLILDFGDKNFALKDIMEKVSYRVSRSGTKQLPLDVIIIKNNSIEKIYTLDK